MSPFYAETIGIPAQAIYYIILGKLYFDFIPCSPNRMLPHWGRVTHIYVSELGQSPMFQVMACRLIDCKPLPEPMITYGQWRSLRTHFHILVTIRISYSKGCIGTCYLHCECVNKTFFLRVMQSPYNVFLKRLGTHGMTFCCSLPDGHVLE